VLERASSDLDMLDWASHLAELAEAAQPGSLAVRVLRARLQRVRGEIDQAVAILELVRANKPEKFVNSEEEEAWYLTHRLLGELYLDDKPDQAVLCLQEFRKSPKSGANTMYNLGRAYENLGDRVRAMRCYEQVIAFEGNPLVYDAREALDRLRGAGSESFS
jgi:tetratricopeptide (TPR) repeat protein